MPFETNYETRWTTKLTIYFLTHPLLYHTLFYSQSRCQTAKRQQLQWKHSIKTLAINLYCCSYMIQLMNTTKRQWSVNSQICRGKYVVIIREGDEIFNYFLRKDGLVEFHVYIRWKHLHSWGEKSCWKITSLFSERISDFLVENEKNGVKNDMN